MTGVVFVVLLAVAFKVGQRKGIASFQSNGSEACGSFGGNNAHMAYTGNA